MCPHTALCMCPHTSLCVLIVPCMSSYYYLCSHAAICVLILLYIPHTAISVSSIILHVSAGMSLPARGLAGGGRGDEGVRGAVNKGMLYMCPHTTVCVLILLYMCPGTTI